MSLLKEVMLKSKVQIELYLSAMEIIDMVQGADDIANDMVADVLEQIGVIHMPMYIVDSIDRYSPTFKSVGGYNIKRDIEVFFQIKQVYMNDASYFNEYKQAKQPLISYRWSRLDLLSLDRLVEHTDIVEWGERQTLLHIYNEMVNNKDVEYQSLPEVSKIKISRFVSIGDFQQELGTYQRLLITYKLFTPEQLVCLMTNQNPACIRHNDEYHSHWDMVNTALDANELTPINEKEQIKAKQVKTWLAKCGFIFTGFNDNLTNDDTGVLNQATTDYEKRIADLEQQLADKEANASFMMGSPSVEQGEPKDSEQIISDLRDQITQLTADNVSLKNQLEQTKAEQADAPADDKELAPKSQVKVTHMLYAILKEHGYDLSPPKGKGVANDQIVAASQTYKSPVTRNFVSNWLERAHQLDIDLNK